MSIRMLLFLILLITACDKEDDSGNPMPNPDFIQLTNATVGGQSILSTTSVVPVNNALVLKFNAAIAADAANAISLQEEQNVNLPFTLGFLDNAKILELKFENDFQEGKAYQLSISNELKAASGAVFPGIEISFSIENEPLEIISIVNNGQELNPNTKNIDLSLDQPFEVKYSHAVDIATQLEQIFLVGPTTINLTIAEIGENEYQLTPQNELQHFSKYNLVFSPALGSSENRSFDAVSYDLYSAIDPTPKFPVVSDEALLTLIQAQTFKYFWDFAHPVSGLARERNTSGETVTSGGSGFGLMAHIVGVERGFITRADALTRWQTIVNFLGNADRFHGAWSHWLNGSTGEVIPFSEKDNGADLVETAFLVQGLLTVRQYLSAAEPAEAALIAQINELWEAVEWSWFTRGGQNVLYWHWSPNFAWDINLRIRGHNETQIIYTLAAASPTFPISKEVYEQGYANAGSMQNGNTFYNTLLPLGSDLGGPLFFTHYSYLGMDPRNLKDQYADYWLQNINHSLINQAYCVDNPLNYVGYAEVCWGLTASDNNEGYSAHSPNNDRGVITPTAAISSLPYTPDASLAAIKHFYYQLGDRLWGEYGFYDAFNPTEDWVASSFLAIDQGPIVIMLENYRTGLLWDLYMSAPEVQKGLDDLGITY